MPSWKKVVLHGSSGSLAHLKLENLTSQNVLGTDAQGNVVAGSVSGYSLPTATSTVLGGIKVGDTLTISSGILNARTYQGASGAVVGGSEGSDGIAGYVPVASSGESLLFLRGDGTWQTPTNTVTRLRQSGGTLVAGDFTFAGSGATTISYSNGTFTISSTDTNTTYSVGDGGLTEKNFTTALKNKLDGITAGADNYASWTISDSVSSEAIRSGDTLIIRGAGAATVSYDTASNIMTISSTDTNTTYSAGTGLTLSGTTFSVTAGTYAAASHTHTISDVTGLQAALDGKAASSHTHDDRYYTESEIDSQISNRLYQASTGTFNVNDFHGTGLYRGSTGNWSNRPTVVHNGGAVLQIDTHPGNYHSQLFFDTGGDRLYLRNANAGTWGSWLNIIHSGNIGSQSVNYATSAGSATTATSATSATYAINATRLYAADSPYRYGDQYPYSMDMRYDGTYWNLSVTPGTPSAVRVAYSDSAGAVAWDNVSSKPSTFTPSSHTHAISDVTGLQTALDGKQAAGSYAAASHTHDDRYYTESEIDSLLGTKVSTDNFKVLGGGISYDTDRRLKVDNGLAIYGAYSGGANSPSTYDIAAQFAFSSRAFELSADWLSTTSPSLRLRTLRDCCDNWSSWVDIISSANIGSQSVNYATSAGSATTATTATNLGTNFTADSWFRATSDNKQVRFYGNSRTMVFRTDGNTNDHGGGAYAYIWYYGGSADGDRRMILNTNGDLWTNTYGWLHDAFQARGSYAASSHTHAISDVTGLQSALDGKLATSGTAANSSQLEGFSAYRIVEESRGVHSSSDFPNGTLVMTDIPATSWAGNSFVMEVSGKSYDSGNSPFKLTMQGYLYADTVINVSAMSYGSYFPGPVKVMEYGSYIAFWWPRGSYWNSFQVHVRNADGDSWNRVTSITDSAEPDGRKKVSCTPIQVIHTNNIGSQSVSYATTAGSANSVAWTNVSSRPTALSQFTNDLGNYGGWYSASGGAINGYVRINQNWAGGDYGGEQLTIRGTYPSIALRNTGDNTKWLIHHGNGPLQFYQGSPVDDNNWANKFEIPTDGNIWMAWANANISTLLDAKQNASTAINTSNIGSQSVSSAGNANHLNTTRDTPSNSLQYWQAPGLGLDEAPSGDWYNTIRMGHGSPLSYYSNTLAIRMTGGGEGDIYTQTIMNGNRQGWKKHWNDGNDGAGSGLDADLLDGLQATAFAAASHTHAISEVTGLQSALDGKAASSHTHDDRYYTESESDGRFLRGTTSPNSVNNFTISIGNNGSYSYVQSHSGQPLYLNPVGNAIVLNSGTSITGQLSVPGVTSGVSVHVGNGSTHGVYTAGDERKQLVVSADHYPHIALVAASANNPTHGAVFSFVGTEGGSARQWNIGIPNSDPFIFSIGYNGTGDNNPHYGVGDAWSGDDKNHARLSIDRSGNTKIRGMLYVNGTSGGITTGNAVIHTGNISSQSVSYAATAGSAPANGGNASTVGGLSTGDFVRAYTTSAGDIDADWGQSFKTFDPVPSGTPPLSSPNIRTINIGENFSRRTQLAFDYASDVAYFRRRDDGGWRTWREFIHSGNIGSQSVSYATSAGNADTVDSLHASSFVRNDTTGQYLKAYYEYGSFLTSERPIDLVNQGLAGGGLRVDFMNPSYTGNGNWGHTITWSGYNGYTMYQLAGSYGAGAAVELYVRNERDHGRTSWSDWRRLLHDGNYSSYALPLSGGTVTGQTTFNSSTYPVFIFSYGNTANVSAQGLQVYSQSGNGAIMAFHRGGHYAVNMGLDSDNVIRIGGWSASANRMQLDMSGNVTFAGNVTGYSDARIKTDIQTIGNALEKVKQLRGVTFRRTDSDDRSTNMGVIAQEVLAVVPEVVSQDASGMYNVAYGNMAGLLIEAIKDQQALIDQQQKQIDELKALIHGLTK